MRKLGIGALIGLVAAVLVLAANGMAANVSGGTGANPFDTVELKTYDWRLSWTARPETARPDIALVEIDEYSLRNAQGIFGRWPWPRAAHAILIDFLSRGPARVIAYDVNFAEPDTRVGVQYGDALISGAESDQQLADAVSRAGNVLLIADATFEGTFAEGVSTVPDQGYRIQSADALTRPVVFPPFETLARAARGFGHNLFVLDSDGPLRHTIPFVRTESSRGLPSLGLAAALHVAGIDPAGVHYEPGALVAGDRRLPLASRRVRRAAAGASPVSSAADTDAAADPSAPPAVVEYAWGLINFRGPALLEDLERRPYASYAFWDLLRSEDALLRGEMPPVDPQVFRDKLVIVGVTASGLHDVFETPFVAGGRMPGAQVHAAVADDLLSSRFMAHPTPGRRVAILVGMAVMIGAIATLLPAWWAAGATAVVLAVFVAIALRAFAAGEWLNVTQPVLASAFALFGGVSYQYFVEGREKRRMTRLFGQYVSKDVFEQLVANPGLARLGGQRREMTVLFSDIRGFTTVSEQGQPEDIVRTLNEYFTRMVAIVFAHKGTLDKFVGDMVMALFGAPLDDDGHAEHAVEAAIEMVEELGRLNAAWQAEGRPALDIGIGINTGPMIAGNIGSEAIMSYTVIGDAVNLGSRLESLNKQYGSRIIISAATRDRLKGRYVIRPLGDVVVKGKSRAVAIFEVVGRETTGQAV